jgi:Tol biopolymer transport system component
VDGKWSEPALVPFSQNFAYTCLPYVTADGSKMLFSGNGKSKDIWVSDKTMNGWSDPYPLPGKVNTDEHAEYFATMTSEGTLYFSSERGDSKCDIYRAERINGEWQQPMRLEGISTNASESNPLIAPDESYMIFMADRPDSFGGYDLYISYKEKGTWSTPLNLGPEINSDVHDFQPALSPDGKYFYFTRTPWPAGSDKRYGREDVYKIDARVLPLKRK